MSVDYSITTLRYQIESEENWKEWLRKIPSLRFDADWDIKVIPPFAGALARFWISKGENHVSVYLDVFSRLGWMYDSDNNPIPYYEIYPSPDDPYDIKRYHLDEVDEMMSDIRRILNKT